MGLRDQMEYEVILNLRTKWGISKSQFFSCYHKSLNEVYDYSSLVKDGYLKEDEDFLFIPEEYWYLSNEVIVRLLEEEVV